MNKDAEKADIYTHTYDITQFASVKIMLLN